MCFLGETRDYLGGVFRPGNHTSAYKAKDFLKAMLQKLPENKVIRLRAEVAFSWDLLKWLWRRGIEFYVVVPQQPWVQRLILKSSMTTRSLPQTGGRFPWSEMRRWSKIAMSIGQQWRYIPD